MRFAISNKAFSATSDACNEELRVQSEKGEIVAFDSFSLLALGF
jgi:hypothetical protein